MREKIKRSEHSKRVFWIASTGGHFMELLGLSVLYESYDSHIFTEKTNSTSVLKDNYGKRMHYFVFGSRVRMIPYLFKFAFNCMKSLVYFFRVMPDYVITTGTHTAVPLCVIASVFRRKVVYIETRSSFSRITKAGQMVYRIADLFVIQRKSLQPLVPNAVLCEVEE